jgi:20S proteasome alpha/beta subunit
MTLIAAFRCRDGVILCSDSQQTRGAPGRRLARKARKIYIPRSGLILAAAGAQDVAQEFALRLRGARGMSATADRLQVKARLQALLDALRKDPHLEGRSDHVEFLIAWWPRQARKPVALHLLSGSAAEWVESWTFGGMPTGTDAANFAMGSMRYIDVAKLTLEQAKVVALKVLRDAIATGAEGIGGEVQMGAVERHRVAMIEDADMQGLLDTLDLWETGCAELLLGGGQPPSASKTPDEGVRPPPGTPGR